jgi:hypothetical protein
MKCTCSTLNWFFQRFILFLCQYILTETVTHTILEPSICIKHSLVYAQSMINIETFLHNMQTSTYYLSKVKGDKPAKTKLSRDTNV